MRRSATCAMLGLVFTGCGARTTLGTGVDASAPHDSGAVAFPLGTYTNCAIGSATDNNGGPFLLAGGFLSGATLTVAQNGDVVTATFVDVNGVSHVLNFAATTSATATLAPGSQATSAFNRDQAICAFGVGVMNEKFYPIELTATAGALTYQSGTMFVSLRAVITSNTDCGVQSSPAGFWITCGDGPSPQIDAGSSPSAPSFPVGTYSCTSRLGEHSGGGFDAGGSFSLQAGVGSLVLTHAGADVIAEYSGDLALAGTLHLMPTTAETANAKTNQSLTASCIGAASGPGDTLLVAAASLAVNDGVVFLSVAGSMSASSSCPGNQAAGGLICLKK